jgi:hypothetical protein
MIRRGFMVAVLVIAFAGAAWTVDAQHRKEAHPVLQRAMAQITNMKGRLQSAPKDFGGHKQKAIAALGLAFEELQQAVQFDK